MKKNKLNSRQKEIIKILTKSKVDSPITASMIAKELSLSARNVLREMPKIEQWLDENEFNFISNFISHLFISSKSPLNVPSDTLSCEVK